MLYNDIHQFSAFSINLKVRNDLKILIFLPFINPLFKSKLSY